MEILAPYVSGNGHSPVCRWKADNYSIASYSYTLDDGKYNAQRAGNANLQFGKERSWLSNKR